MSAEYNSFLAMRRHRDAWILKNVICKYVNETNEDKTITGATLQKYITTYRPTFDLFDQYIDEYHRRLADMSRVSPGDPNVAAHIPGYLVKADALKLYEMAYYCEGDILELGCYAGLSTSIMATALSASKSKNGRIIGVEISPARAEDTKRNLAKMNVAGRAEVICGDAQEVCDNLIAANAKFGFIFVDHSHSYEHTYEACKRIPALLVPGGYCMFHDFSHVANFVATDPEYGFHFFGVPHAVLDALTDEDFELLGIYGLAALYRRRS
ncbi:MAG: class I SAM-dependent methyltransferase [Deltaproteobacteria bacterium]|nr:class I SAM-dependent methyltransferase [Deltaproteobacteria bacterium]